MKNYLKNSENKISNVKIMVLLGKQKVDGKNRDGEVDTIMKSDNDEFYYHAVCLGEYLTDNFKDCYEAQEADKSNADAMLAAITSAGAISIAETTSPYHPNTILIFLPKNISEKQAENLKLLKKKLLDEDYNLQILYDLHKNEEGITDGRQRKGKAGALDKFIEEAERDR